MIKEIGDLTPKDILKFLGVYVQKPKPNSELVKNSIMNLPISGRENLELIGFGDWNCGRSSHGSAIVSAQESDFVVKFPVGESKIVKDPTSAIRMAKELKKNSTMYPNSPETSFFITQLDGPSTSPKICIFQRKNNGQPTCDTKLKVLFSEKSVAQFNKVVEYLSANLLRESLLDSIGLKLDTSNVIKRTIVRLICGFVWFSDNTMVSIDGNIDITDNTPDNNVHKISNSLSKYLQYARIKISWQIAQGIAKLYNLTQVVFSKASQINTNKAIVQVSEKDSNLN